MKSPFRELIVVAAGIVIAGLCWWRMSAPEIPRASLQQVVADQRMAPTFELYDQQSHLVKLSGFVGRHPIVLIFFDGRQPPENDRSLVMFRDFYPSLRTSGVIVLGVSSALPQQIRRKSVQPFPFPILADVTAGQPGSASLIWGCSAASPRGTANGSQGTAMGALSSSSDADHAAKTEIPQKQPSASAGSAPSQPTAPAGPAPGNAGEVTAPGAGIVHPAVFLVDRSGMVNWTGDRPMPVADPKQLLEMLLRGEI
jgi:peroxiredoxin